MGGSLTIMTPAMFDSWLGEQPRIGEVTEGELWKLWDEKMYPHFNK